METNYKVTVKCKDLEIVSTSCEHDFEFQTFEDFMKLAKLHYYGHKEPGTSDTSTVLVKPEDLNEGTFKERIAELRTEGKAQVTKIS